MIICITCWKRKSNILGTVMLGKLMLFPDIQGDMASLKLNFLVWEASILAKLTMTMECK
jgi:hypothetical protein